MTVEGGSVGVLVVDDHAHFRQAAREMVEATPGFVPVGEASNGEEALGMVGRLRPELVLLDVRMPGKGGIETARNIRESYPQTTVVLVSLDDRSALPDRAVSCGAAAFVNKRDLCSALLERLWGDHGRRP